MIQTKSIKEQLKEKKNYDTAYHAKKAKKQQVVLET